MAPQPPQNLDITSLQMSWWSARNPPSNPTHPFTGKTILITGANVGLGFEAAVKFAALDAARLILGVRSLERGEAAKTEICRRSNYDGAKVKLYELDMCRFASVQDFAERIDKGEERVDVGVLNAGVAASAYVLSPEGYESTLQVNVLSTALLAVLLLPKLRSSAALVGGISVLEFVGSSGHHLVKPKDFELDGERGLIEQANEKGFFEPKRSYCVSKLFVMYIMEGILQEVANNRSGASSGEGKGNGDVVILATCTALCRTNLGRDFATVLKMVNGLYQYVFARTAEQGSRSIVSGAGLGKDAMGEFWSHDVFFRKGEMVTTDLGKKVQKRVWSEIKEILMKEVGDLDRYFKP